MLGLAGFGEGRILFIATEHTEVLKILCALWLIFFSVWTGLTFTNDALDFTLHPAGDHVPHHFEIAEE